MRQARAASRTAQAGRHNRRRSPGASLRHSTGQPRAVQLHALRLTSVHADMPATPPATKRRATSAAAQGPCAGMCAFHSSLACS